MAVHEASAALIDLIPPSQMLEIDDYFWDDLLEYIEEGKVIPVIGSQLGTVESGEDEITFYRYVADQLAGRLRVRPRDLPENFDINDVVVRFLENRGKREEIYPRIRTLLKEVSFKPPASFQELARISPLNLFVSLTFDSLLADAINSVRFGGNPKTDVLAYTPNDVQDLNAGKKNLDRPVVYQLLGKLSASPDYVVCDEDLLEFLKAMQTDSRKPNLLFDELQDNHLLFIGCDYSDWLVRFIIRISRNQPLSMRRDYMEVLVGDNIVNNESLVMFLENFSYNTKLVPGTGAEFVAELARRWLERHPQAQEEQVSAPTPAPSPSRDRDPLQMPPGGIFLSYASDDVKAVTRIRDSLEMAGLDVWFDKGELRTGDDWDLKIRRNVGTCSLFMPVISKSTEARPEGYFRREWSWAADRALGIADGIPFLIPLTIDETKPYTARIPERFKANQFTHLPDGEVSGEFVERIKELVRDFHRRQKGA